MSSLFPLSNNAKITFLENPQKNVNTYSILSNFFLTLKGILVNQTSLIAGSLKITRTVPLANGIYLNIFKL